MKRFSVLLLLAGLAGCSSPPAPKATTPGSGTPATGEAGRPPATTTAPRTVAAVPGGTAPLPGAAGAAPGGLTPALPTTPGASPGGVAAGQPGLAGVPGASAPTGASPGATGAAPGAPGGPEMSFQQMKQQVEAAVKRQPNDFPMRMQAAAFYMQAGDHASAIPHLKVATGLTKLVLPWIALGDAATLSGQFPLAKQAYDRAQSIEPHNPLIIRGQGQMYVAQRQLSKAQAVLEAGLQAHPGNGDLCAALGNLYIVLNKPRKAIDVLALAVKAEPNRADNHALLGEAYERDLHLEKAVVEMREAVRLDPSLSEAWGKLGLYLVKLTRYQEAREPLQRAIAIEPAESHYYWALGDSYMLESTDETHFKQAEQLYLQALKIDPRNDKALYSYAMSLTRRGKPADLTAAIDLFNRLVAINPNDINAHFKLTETYRRLGRQAEAKAHEAKFQDLFTKGRDQTRRLYRSVSYKDTAEAHLKLGRAAMAKRDYALASQEFQLALQRNSMMTEARKGLLEAQRKLGQAPKTQ